MQLHTPSLVQRVFLAVLLALTALLTVVKTAEFYGASPFLEKQQFSDFHAFHVVGQMYWRGDVEQAYNFASFVDAQQAVGEGLAGALVWAYPPQFTLFVAPTALVPIGLAYFVFISITLVAFLVILRWLAGQSFTLVLATIFPALMVTIASGQNGFLTGSLIGLACMGFLRQSSAAGIPLGLMIVKPHLAAGFGIYVLATRCWRAMAIAAIIVVVTALLTTTLLGPAIWTAFLQGTAEMAGFLEAGRYPLYRMISVYAAMRTFGFSAPMAMTMQAVVAMILLALVFVAICRSVPLRQVLALTTFASLLVSPYAYDYDLPILGIAVALLATDLLRLATYRELITLLGLTWFACFWGTVQTSRIGPEGLLEGVTPLSLAGIALLAVLGVACFVLQRDWALAASGPHSRTGLQPRPTDGNS